jgi:hypothetical protein
MSREQHEKQITDLQNRHQAALDKFTKLQPANLEWWRHRYTTTPQQLELLAALVEQFEATELVARAAAQNLNSALQVVIEANTPNR